MYLYLDRNFEFIFYMNIFVDWYIASFEIEKKNKIILMFNFPWKLYIKNIFQTCNVIKQYFFHTNFFSH